MCVYVCKLFVKYVDSTFREQDYSQKALETPVQFP